MALIPMNDVRARVATTIAKTTPYQPSEEQKKENIRNFGRLPRQGLLNGELECRLLLYQTRKGEKVFMQYPGIESARPNATKRFELDARPVLQRADGTYLEDLDFKKIWDIMDQIGQGHKDDIDILATLFLRIAYMLDYKHNDAEYLCETVGVENGTVLKAETIPFVWNSLYIHEDVLDTLNDRFGDLAGASAGISLEGFLYYNDLLAQNEDCKYSYFHGDKWNITTGRINNCLSHLTIISHIRGYIGISKLIDSFQRTGVAPLPQSRFYEACGDLVKRI